MEIDHLVLGDFETNCFCVRRGPEAKECIVIDAGMSAEVLIEHLKNNEYTPVAVILTHGHADHIAGVKLLKDNYPEIKVVIHKLDSEMLVNPMTNLSMLTGNSIVHDPADIVLEHEESIEYAGMKFDVIHTPGHTPGGMCLYCKDDGVIFVGDTLFAGSIGRTDFPGGNFDALISGVTEKLFVLPDDTKTYCGHGPATTIGREKNSNPFFQQEHLQ